MKRKLIFLLIFLLCVALLLSACTQPEPPAPEDDSEQAAAEQAYLDRIAELEATLQREREERYISDISYQNKIRDLEARLDIKPPAENDTAVEECVFHYMVTDGCAILTGYEGNANLINIPATLDGYRVVAIGERAFEGKSPLSVTVPDGVESIGWFAFYNCQSLVDITIPESVTSIGYAVFDGCASLTIVCPDNSFAAKYAESFGLPHISP
ncbi:MAG: leucine-rich repeat domain-containing protein [Clostridia bacterium]|nr:leucine-rich repeat domain-containing protein [Clostridia bacterium]